MPSGSEGYMSWHGRMDEVEFLKRLYDVESLPSYDQRYKDAEGDIRCHTGWGDWESDWVFSDPRFDLETGEDEVFLNFVCETFHPAVAVHSIEDSEGAEKYYLADILKIIESEGYELFESKRLGNKPVLRWREKGISQELLDSQTETLRQAFDSVYLNKQITQMKKAVKDNPSDAIGKAKDLVESCCKTILEAESIIVDHNWEIPRLLKEVQIVLDDVITPQNVQDYRTDDTIRKFTGNLSQIGYRLTELRNQIGTGHGRSDNFTSIDTRFAELAVGASATLCVFLWETYEELIRQRNS